MAEFNFNALQQVVHDAHASMSDPHAEPSDIHYIPPSSDCMPPAPGAPEYPSHQAIVQERMSQMELQRIDQARADIAANLDAQRQQAADEITGQIDADIKADNHTGQESQPPADTGEPKRGRSPKHVRVASLDVMPALNAHNCPLLVFIAVSRVHQDRGAAGYVAHVDKNGERQIHIQKSTRNDGTIIPVPDNIPIHNDDGDLIVVTASQVRGAHATAGAVWRDTGEMLPGFAEGMLALFPESGLDAVKRNTKRRSDVKERVSMAEALRCHIMDNGFVTHATRGKVCWAWPHAVRDDGNGNTWRVYGRLSYDGNNLTYIPSPDKIQGVDAETLNDYELLPYGRVNLAEFTRTNRTRIAAHDSVSLPELIEYVATLALTDEETREAFYGAKADPALTTLFDEYLHQTPCNGFEYGAAMSAMLQSATGSPYYRIIKHLADLDIVRYTASAEDVRLKHMATDNVAERITNIFRK